MDTCVPYSRLVSHFGTTTRSHRHLPQAHLLAMSLTRNQLRYKAYCDKIAMNIITFMNVDYYFFTSQVDYSATAEELEQHFHGCGSVNRVTILCDKFSGHPKGLVLHQFTLPLGIKITLFHSC